MVKNLKILILIIISLSLAASKNQDSVDYFDSFLKLGETLGKGFINHMIENKNMNFKECEFNCPNKKLPKLKPNYIPKSNGCGSHGFNIDFTKLDFTEFNDCCHVHDICYGTCNQLKLNCDHEFKDCLFNHCSTIRKDNPKHIVCKETAEIMYKMVLNLGCPSYGLAQKEACICK